MEVLREKGIPKKYTRVIKDMCKGERTRVRIIIGYADNFFIYIRLHQGSALSHFLFTIAMDELTRGIQDEIS